jgi:hypothetical protein
MSNFPEAALIGYLTSRGTGICYKPAPKMELTIASVSSKPDQEPARQNRARDHFYGQATLPIAAGRINGDMPWIRGPTKLLSKTPRS